MAAKGKYKCPICGLSCNDENSVVIGTRHYHIGECEKKKKEKKKKKEVRKSDWDLLFDYICKLYNVDKPSMFIFKQISDFKKKYDFTDYGIYATLKYYYETLENNLIEDVGIGIVEYYYDEAKKHIEKVYDLEDYMENFEDTSKTINVDIKIKNNKIDISKQLKELGSIQWESEESK